MRRLLRESEDVNAVSVVVVVGRTEFRRRAAVGRERLIGTDGFVSTTGSRDGGSGEGLASGSVGVGSETGFVGGK